MSFVVVGKSPKAHYTQISNALIRNSEIDDSTFRLICWMSSHDEGYQINFKNIQFALGYGRDKLRKILKNAEAHNYLVRRKIRTDGGLFDFEYHIFKDTSHAIAFSKSLPQSELINDSHTENDTQKYYVEAGFRDGEQGTNLQQVFPRPPHLCTSDSHNAKFTPQTTDVTRGGFTGGGSAGGGSTRGGFTGGGSTGGGESTPLLEEQYKENQIKEEQEEEERPSFSKNSLSESEDFSPKEQPTPQNFVSLSNFEESCPKTDNPEFRPNIPLRWFDKPEQSNLTSSLPVQNKYNAAARCDQLFKQTNNAPWRITAKDFDSGFVEHWRSMLAKSQEWRERGMEPMNGDAKRSLCRMEKFDLESLEALWEAYNERKQARIEQLEQRAQLEPEP